MKQDLLCSIPKVDDVINYINKNAEIDGLSNKNILESTRETLDNIRASILQDKIDEIPHIDSITKNIVKLAKEKSKFNLCKVINCTGVVLHTNLGRSPMSEKVAEHVKNVAMSYSNLEYDIEKGQRGSRHSLVEGLICELVNAPGAMVVNNNAAAVLLILSALCKDEQVIVSRGELVEIGGSFRVPDIMEESGAVLKEIGTTNKTKARDYESAICEETAALLKVHTSNFQTIGFTEEASIDELVKISQENNIPLIYDLGSGFLGDIDKLRDFTEPSVKEAVEAGVDVISFSGDKLLGGPQAGIIIGKKDFIEKIKTHPLARAFRVDKLTLAALEATLKLYLDEKEGEVPIIQMLSDDVETLEIKGKKLLKELESINGNFDSKLVESDSQVGGGSAPGKLIPSMAIEILPKEKSLVEVEAKLRKREVPIIVRISRDRILLDMRTISERDFPYIIEGFKEVFTKEFGEK